MLGPLTDRSGVHAQMRGAHVSHGSHPLRRDVLHQGAVRGRARGAEPAVADRWPAGAVGKHMAQPRSRAARSVTFLCCRRSSILDWKAFGR